MSTRCAAKNLFLYYRKYLSEHICNKLLWEHIPGILFTQRTQVGSRLDSGLWSIASPPRLLPTFPVTHGFGKWVQPVLPAFAKISIHMAVDLPMASLVLLKGTVISSASFLPRYFPAAHRQKYLSLPNGISSLADVSEESACLALLGHPLSFREPRTPGSIRRALA